MSTDRLDEIWSIQREFTRNFISNNVSREEKIKYTKEMLLHLVAEIDELLNATGSWKLHRIVPERAKSRYTLVEEAVDIFKFLLNVLIAWDVTAEEFYEVFKNKSELVAIRYEMEKRAVNINGKVAVIDIDGVLNTYPEPLLRLIEHRVNKRYNSLAAAKRDLGALYEEIKHEFRESGLEAKQPLRPGAKTLFKWLSDNNYSIVLLTSRPAAEYRRIEIDTISWLKLHSLPYDLVLFAEDKLREIRSREWKVFFVLEDDLANALRFAEEGYRVYWLNTSDKFVIKSNNLFEVKTLPEVIELERKFAQACEG